MAGSMDYKVGIRILSESQLKNVFPMYENLDRKIEACREVAQNSCSMESRRHYQYNFMYDNVFSVLGKRGTGKTSVAFTLQERIEENAREEIHPYDVVLPLIIPEAIPEDCSVLGWILAIVKDKMTELENRIENGRVDSLQKDCGWGRCQVNKECSQSLMGRLKDINQLFFAGKYNPSNEASYYKAVGNAVLQAEDYYKFAQHIANLWDAWVERIKDLWKLQGRQELINEEPMIYFIFDDVDLAPEKVDEILSVIIKYLSHPNLIVITTADEDLLMQVIENKLDKNIGNLPKEWRNYLDKSTKVSSPSYFWNSEREEESKKKDLINETACMYLGKVMPPSTRYYLKLFHTAEEKLHFYVGENLNLGDGVVQAIDRLAEYQIDSKKYDNFMHPGKVTVKFYLNYFGETSRQIVNSYIGTRELMENLIDNVQCVRENAITKEEYLDRIYYNCCYFLCMAVTANHQLSEFIENVREFVDDIFFREYNQWKLYINYRNLNDALEKMVSNENKQKQVEVGLQAYSLFIFMENILLLLKKCTEYGLDGRDGIAAIPYFSEYIRENVFRARHIFRDDLEPNRFFMHYDNLLNRLDKIAAEDMQDLKFNIEYFYIFKNFSYQQDQFETLEEIRQKNKRWFGELAGMLSMVYGNVYLLDKRTMEECSVFVDEACLVGYQGQIDVIIENNIENAIVPLDLKELFDIEKYRLEECFSEEREEKFSLLVQEIENAFYSNEGRRVIRLRDVVQSVCVFVLELLDGDSDLQSDSFVQFVEYLPNDLAKELKSQYENMMVDSGIILDLMQQQMQEVKTFESDFTNVIYIYDIEHWTGTLMEMAKVFPHSTVKRLNTIIRDIAEKGEEVQVNARIIMDIRQYSEIKQCIASILEIIPVDADYSDDGPRFRRELRELGENIDLCVASKPSDWVDFMEFEHAVKLGMRVCFIAYLQRLYIYQIIAQRYEHGHSLSSKDLETYEREGQQEDTYYYMLFQSMKEKIATYNTDTGSDLCSVIERAALRERKKYLDRLFAGEGNE